MQIEARHYRTGRTLSLTIEHGVIRNVTDLPTTNAKAPWIAPAFCDIQINGCEGISFNSPKLTAENVGQVVGVCRRHGISQLCPTLVTGSFEALAHGLRTLRKVCEADAEIARAIPGIHVEGPYISSEDGPRGAHPRAHVRPPDWDEFLRLQDAAGGRIRMMTLVSIPASRFDFADDRRKS